jgi:hypothetical protein
MEFFPTLLPFLGAVIGAMIGATVSPFVQWQIEKKRQRLAYRRELILRWRKMLEEVVNNRADKWAGKEIHQIMFTQGDFASLVMYSRDPKNTTDSEWKNYIEMGEKYGIPPMIMHYIHELQRLEEQWKLV